MNIQNFIVNNHEKIIEIEINPFILTENDGIAVDALINKQKIQELKNVKFIRTNTNKNNRWNYRDNYKLLAPVGTFKKDIAGLYDLTGNVKEWVHDYYLLSVPKNNVIYYDPSGPKSGVGHVVKGSSYLSATLQEIRASYRDSEVYKKEDLGFRIARYLFGKEFKNDEE